MALPPSPASHSHDIYLTCLASCPPQSPFCHHPSSPTFHPSPRLIMSPQASLHLLLLKSVLPLSVIFSPPTPSLFMLSTPCFPPITPHKLSLPSLILVSPGNPYQVTCAYLFSLSPLRHLNLPTLHSSAVPAPTPFYLGDATLPAFL